jgi:hypothetical protein
LTWGELEWDEGLGTKADLMIMTIFKFQYSPDAPGLNLSPDREVGKAQA